MRKWRKWLVLGLDVLLGLYIAAFVALATFLPTFHDCTCFGGPTPLERFGNAVEEVVCTASLVVPIWGLVRAYYCLRTCSLRRWWRILAGLVLWPPALCVLYLVGYNIYSCIKKYYWPPSWVKEPTFDWSCFLPAVVFFTITVIAIAIGEKKGFFKRDASGRES